jgi:hypothetical protein
MTTLIAFSVNRCRRETAHTRVGKTRVRTRVCSPSMRPARVSQARGYRVARARFPRAAPCLGLQGLYKGRPTHSPGTQPAPRRAWAQPRIGAPRTWPSWSHARSRWTCSDAWTWPPLPPSLPGRQNRVRHRARPPHRSAASLHRWAPPRRRGTAQRRLRGERSGAAKAPSVSLPKKRYSSPPLCSAMYPLRGAERPRRCRLCVLACRKEGAVRCERRGSCRHWAVCDSRTAVGAGATARAATVPRREACQVVGCSVRRGGRTRNRGVRPASRRGNSELSSQPVPGQPPSTLSLAFTRRHDTHLRTHRRHERSREETRAFIASHVIHTLFDSPRRARRLCSWP